MAYLGPNGSFTHEAAERHFQTRPHELLPCKTIGSTFEAVRREEANFGVVPIESLRQGPVIESFMELKKASPCRIVGEDYVPVQLYLIVHPDADLDAITTVRSKAEGIRQCGRWIEEQQAKRAEAGLPPWEFEEISSTAKAAADAADDPKVAGISSRFVTDFYDVKVIGRDESGHEGIQDLPDGASYTRFLVLGRSAASRADYPASSVMKTSFWFILTHRTGALLDALQPFRSAGISLESIQPMPFRATHRQIEYVFFMDFIGHIADDAMIRAVREAEETCAVEYLGSYPRAEMPQAVFGPVDR